MPEASVLNYLAFLSVTNETSVTLITGVNVTKLSFGTDKRPIKLECLLSERFSELVLYLSVAYWC
jgi:hypothetical protein